MAPVQPVMPVKLLIALLWSAPQGQMAGPHAPDAQLPGAQASCPPSNSSLDESLRLAANRWGKIDFQGPDRLFDSTHYYEPEMGPTLQRRIISFETLVPPESLTSAKLFCNELEQLTAEAGRRKVNLDVGYLDHNKIVLASLKYAGQKIHLADGVYADLIARYESGCYRPFPWTFPDFNSGRYDEELRAIRGRYLAQLRR
jgi:hypothetical protein